MNIQKQIVDLTPSQLRAIATEPVSDRIVIAMAGSGKTTVLTEYYHALIMAGFKPKEIIAITFTEKAARSMKVKLIRKMADSGKPDSAGELHDAPISTIHSFLGQLVREYTLTLGLDPDWRVLDEMQADILVEQTLRDLMFLWRKDKPDKYGLLISKLEWGHDPYTQFQSFWGDLNSRGLRPGKISPGGDVNVIFNKYKDGALESIDNFLHAITYPGKKNKTDERRIMYAQELHTLLDSLLIDQCGAEVMLELDKYLAQDRIGWGFAKAIEIEGKSLRENIKDLISVIPYISGRDVREAFIELVCDFEREYRKNKELQNYLDFNDFELYAEVLLKNHPEICSYLKSTYRALLIDEFQDTNPVQMSIMEKFMPDRGFYAVGDPRQSIYGFRHADVGIMLGMMKEYGESGKSVVELDENFRSREIILKFTSENFKARPIDSKFPGKSFGDIKAGRVFVQGAYESPVEMIISSSETMDEARLIETRAIANRLGFILNQGFSVEDRDKNLRELMPSDCVMLFRSGRRMIDYARALEGNGIPYVVTTGSGFYNQREIMDLANYFDLLLNPDDHQLLADVLRSSFYGIHVDGLFTIIMGLRSLKDHGSTFLKEDFQQKISSELMESDKEKFIDLVEDFRYLMDVCQGEGPSVRIRHILEKTHFRGIISRGRGGTRRLGNIAKLMDIADDWENDLPGDNRGFIKRIKELRFRDVREAESPVTSSSESVTLMTIHASKGLEFPLVILADAASQVRADASPWIVSEDGGIFLKRQVSSKIEEKYKEDMYFSGQKEEKKNRGRDESSRLLYVALTRAIEKLIVSVAFSGKTNSEFLDIFMGASDIGQVIEEPKDSLRVGSITIPVFKGCDLIENPVQYKQDSVKQVTIDVKGSIEQIKSWQPRFDRSNLLYSATEISTWIVCPRLYQYRHELGLGTLEGEISAFDSSIPDSGDEREVSARSTGLDEFPVLERGKFIHEMLYQFVKNGDEFSVTDFINKAISLKFKANSDDLNKILSYVKESEPGRSLLKSLQTRLEESVTFRDVNTGMVLRAIPDAAWIENDKWQIIDYKTGKLHDEKNRDMIGIAYACQLRIYAMALKSISGLNVAGASLLFVDQEKCIDIDLSSDSMANMNEILDIFHESTGKGIYQPVISGNCEFCSFRIGCPAW